MRIEARYNDTTFALQYFSRKEREQLTDKNINAAAYRMDWDDRRRRMIDGREESIALLKYNAERGMSRARMCQIWGSDFVRIVMDEL